MTDMLKAEVIEALAKICDDICVKAWDRYKRGDHRANPHDQGRSDGANECAEAIRSFDLTPFQVKVPEDIRSVLRNVGCQCKLVERESGHRTDCWRPELDSLIESLSAQLAERDREIAWLRALKFVKAKELPDQEG